MNEEKTKRKFGTVSIPMGVIEAIDDIVEELRYWPSRAAFAREACLEKIRSEQERLKQVNKAKS